LPPRPARWSASGFRNVRLRDIDGGALERFVVFGHAIGVYNDDRFIKNGRLDAAAMRPIARCGYDKYVMVESVFKKTRPKGGG
jgi:hypothetical protein